MCQRKRVSSFAAYKYVEVSRVPEQFHGMDSISSTATDDSILILVDYLEGLVHDLGPKTWRTLMMYPTFKMPKDTAIPDLQRVRKGGCARQITKGGSRPTPMVLCPVGSVPWVGQTYTLFTVSKEYRSFYLYARQM